MIFFLAILPALYITWLIIIFIAWKRIPGKTRNHEFNENVAVIIPVRNEEPNIGSLLFDLDKQDYPLHLVTVFVVDDASVDQTSAVVKQMMSMVHYVLEYRLLEEKNGPPYGFSGKKSAITQIVGETSAGLILQTDGDSRVNSGWISSLVSGFVSSKAQLMAGPVIYRPGESVLRHLLQFDIASLGIVSASMINLGIPVMCSGASMAYRRDAFILSGGYSENIKIASGDDSFLMHSIAERHPGSVKFIKDSSSIVQTQPPGNWNEFFQQRMRWAGKWKYHSRWAIKWLAVFIFLVHLDFICLAAWSAYSWTFSVTAILLAARILFEWILLKSFLSFAGCKTSLPVFLAAAILYPFYAVFFGILSNTATFTWKGRTYNN